MTRRAQRAGTAWIRAIAAAVTIGCGGLGAGAACASEHAEPPVEIYTRLAKGALTCWFGTRGSLKKTHIFHADVAPQAAGGAAEITLQQRDPSGETPRAFRAYRISIAPTGSGSSVVAENFRLPAETAREMEGDVRRWAGGDTSCSVIGVGGWTAQQVKEPAQEPAGKTAKKKKDKQPAEATKPASAKSGSATAKPAVKGAVKAKDE